MEGRPTWTDCDEAGDYVVPNVLSPRDLVSRPDKMDETVPHIMAKYICHMITTACFSLCITTACFSLCICTLNKHAILTSFLMYCLSANLLFFSLLLTNEPPHIKNTDKYVLSDIHSGGLGIAIDRWLLIAKCMSFLHYFHAAISNHLSEKPKICIVAYGRLTQV